MAKKKGKKVPEYTKMQRRMGPSQVRHGDLYTLRIYLQEAADPQIYNDVKHIFWQVKGAVLTVLQLFPGIRRIGICTGLGNRFCGTRLRQQDSRSCGRLGAPTPKGK